MRFRETEIADTFIVEPERHVDERGFFARTWCPTELEAANLDHRLAQCSISWNAERGTLRGMHYQRAPMEETKVVRCTNGAIFDVVIDLRRHSPTFRGWVGRELTADNRHAMYVPKGCAHGFLTLTDDTEVLYMISEFYEPALAAGVRWDDPSFGVDWPLRPSVISGRDASYPDFGAG
jgi:dTDP-4-dehydrorhamnose 3,5-epimerase